MTTFLFGTTTNGLAIQGFSQLPETPLNPSRKLRHVLILGGVHGDEVEGVVLAQALLNYFLSQAPNQEMNLHVSIVPTMNLDGVLEKTRGNANGVDLNRNLPTKDWSPVATTPRYQPGPHALSESENKALVHFIDHQKPDFIISLHSWKPMLNINEPAGGTLCRQVAEAIATHTSDIIEPTIGYSTPGCLGTYAGFERNIPTLTYEIERGLEAKVVVRKHLHALVSGLKVLEANH